MSAFNVTPTVTSNLTSSTMMPVIELASATKRTVGHSQYHMVLLSIYSLVLLSGSFGLSLMMRNLHANVKSITTIAVLNLIFTHFLFLITVPFRIYYYTTHQWNLSLGWCKTVSGMIHIHMYVSFVLYVVILVTRLMAFYGKAEPMEVNRKLYALVMSAALWMVVIIVVPCVLHFLYGQQHDNGKDDHSSDDAPSVQHCFQFGSNIEKEYAAKVFNYMTSLLIIVVTIVLTALQANVLLVLYRKFGRGCISQQEFWAQVKSLCFAIIMVVFFLPYHMFRLYYIEHLDLQDINEVFLSMTTLTCLDMLTFIGRGTCYMCYQGQRV